MHESYDDIRSRIDSEPLWWDEHAVPRYEPFEPRMLANIYWREAALLLIICQGCGREFQVAMSTDDLRWTKDGPVFDREQITKAIRSGSLHYGDPPNIGCCAAGPVMNSIPLRVLEMWRRDKVDEQRIAELEGSIRALATSEGSDDA